MDSLGVTNSLKASTTIKTIRPNTEIREHKSRFNVQHRNFCDIMPDNLIRYLLGFF